MNIFVLDSNPIICAQYHNDKHVVKMIIESTQLLSNAVILSGFDSPYKLSHKNHPCTKWVCKSMYNWFWLYTLTEALNDEWKYRYDHDYNHKAFDVAQTLHHPILPDIGYTPFALVMPDQYKCDDTVESYRQYYIHDKLHLDKWTKRKVPDWWVNKDIVNQVSE